MKLFGSLVVTGLIVATVWGVALLQPGSSFAAKHAEEETVVVPEKTDVEKVLQPQTQAGESFSAVDLVSVTRTIAISEVGSLWTSFTSSPRLNQSLTRSPDRVFVFYRNFSSDFQSAKVSIGYSEDVMGKTETDTRVPAGRYQAVLARGAHTDAKLASAWQNIDFRKPLNSVVEIHYLNDQGATVTSEMLVDYQ